MLVNLLFAGDTVNIGEVSYKLKTPQNPELVPVKHSMLFSNGVFRETVINVSASNGRLNGTLFGSASFRLPTPDGGSAPKMDYAERSFGPGCVSHWSTRATEAIYSYAVPCEYAHRIQTDHTGL